MNTRSRTATLLGIIAGSILALATSAQAIERKEFHQTYPVTADSSFGLTNVNGDVQIKGWDRNEIKVDAITTADDREYLDEIKIEVNATSNSVEIKTRYPEHMRDRQAKVEYTIMLPRQARIRRAGLVNGSMQVEGVKGAITASLVNGDLSVTDASSDLKIDSVNGQIHATIAKLGSTTKASAVNGDLSLTLPSDADTTVSASTVSGSISTQFGIHVERPRYGPGSAIHAQLGSGTNTLSLSTVSGDISLQHASDGKTVSKVTQSKSDREDDDLN